MRNKKLAAGFGLLSVLLMSLSAAAAPGPVRTSLSTTGSDVASPGDASTIFASRVATPSYSWVRTWRGAYIVYISCDTPGATIWYTWNGSSARIYRYPLYVTSDAVLRAQATKTGRWNSYVNTLIIDFPPYGNVR